MNSLLFSLALARFTWSLYFGLLSFTPKPYWMWGDVVMNFGPMGLPVDPLFGMPFVLSIKEQVPQSKITAFSQTARLRFNVGTMKNRSVDALSIAKLRLPSTFPGLCEPFG